VSAVESDVDVGVSRLQADLNADVDVDMRSPVTSALVFCRTSFSYKSVQPEWWSFGTRPQEEEVGLDLIAGVWRENSVLVTSY
jgi:hypothetical protein